MKQQSLAHGLQGVRTHFVMPRILLEALDRLVESKRRSIFVANAVAEKLEYLAQQEALAQAAGMLKASRTPEWETPQATSAWVRSMRREADHRGKRQ